MQSASIFSKSLGGRAAPLWPAVFLVCAALVLVFLKTLTDEGLAWAVSIEPLRNAGFGTWVMMGAAGAAVMWAMMLSTMIMMFGVSGLDDLVLGISGVVGSILVGLLYLLLLVVDRMPAEAIISHTVILRSVQTAAPDDVVANRLRQLLAHPTYAGLEGGNDLIRKSIQGEEMERAMVAARIIGIDRWDVVETARTRGWMTPREFKLVHDKVMGLIRDHSHDKSAVWQAAALVMVDRQALSVPLAIRAKEVVDE